jgi:hypothetical protein
LATFNISKAKDETGKEIDVSEAYSEGLVLYEADLLFLLEALTLPTGIPCHSYAQLLLVRMLRWN